MSTPAANRLAATLILLALAAATAAECAAAPFRPDQLSAFAQQAYLKASNTETDDHFGVSVAISGNTMVVGAPSEDSNATGVNGNQNDNSSILSGAAYVFVRTGATWTQQAYLKASNSGLGDGFGLSVAISGDTVVVGAPGERSNATGVNGNQNDDSALAAGAAYVFVRAGTTWSQQAYLKASHTAFGNQFGSSVGIAGDTIVVGAFQDGFTPNGGPGNQDAPGSGAAYVFVRSGTTWSPQAHLRAANADDQDFFGWSVAIAGDTIVVGAYQEDSSATGVNGNPNDDSLQAAGAAYVFVRSGGTWSQQAYLKASNTDANDGFGWSVAISGDTIVVGANFESSNATGVNGNQVDDSGPASGAVYVFVRAGAAWSQQAYLKASNTDAGDFFGWSVGIAGDTLVVSAHGERSNATGVNGNQTDDSAVSGAAYVLARSGSTWSQAAYLKASNTDQVPTSFLGDLFGQNVAISGDTIVVGADREDSSATGSNGNQSDNSALDSGAAYVFRFEGQQPAPPAGAWLQTPTLPGFRFKVRIDGNRQGTQVADCVPQTLCVAGAIPTRAELFVRIIGPRPNGKLWAQAVRFTVSQVELWIEQTGSGKVNYYLLDPLAASTAVLPGVNDSVAFDPSGSTQNQESATVHFLPLAKVDPAPPAGNWLQTAALPGFRFKVLIDGVRAGTPVADCVPQTLCIAGAIPTRAELFVRIIGPRPNGKLWAQAVRFTVSKVELWIEQTGTGKVNYYLLDALPASTTVLTGVNDSLAFTP